MPPRQLHPDSLALTLLLTLLVSFGPLSVDLYVPSMPEVAQVMQTHSGEIQFTISLYLMGFAVGQVVGGPISDRYGRKPAILGSFALYCLGSLLCLSAHGFETLVAGRIVQGFGVSGSVVATRAMVRDMYEGARASLQFSTMNMFMGLMPIFAPLMGGVLAKVFGWHSVFVFQFCAGFGTLALALFFVTESRPVASAISPGVIFANYRFIATNGAFLANMAIGVLAYAGLFAWIVGSPFVLQTIVGLSPLGYSICYAASCTGFIIGGWLGTKLVVSHGLNAMAGVGAAFCTVAGILIVISAAAGVALPVTLPACMGVYFIGLAILLAQSTTAALMPFPNQAGTASSLIGFAQQCAGATMGTLVGATLSKSTALPMAIFVAIAGCGTLVLWVVTRNLRGVH
jgi:DHA1 family bicyclomycin/chloramphenicol resistance-like MFS transporter